jgi:glycosyltransferase involved in cell wall biosynthesis
MKVIIFVNTSWNIYNFRSGLVRALQKSGYEVHALAPEDDYSVRLSAMGCIYHPIRMKNTGGNPLLDLDLIRRIYKLYRNIKPQIILHYTVKPNIYGTMVARWLRIPSISTVSGLGTVFLTSGKTSSIARYLYGSAFKYPQRIFFQNQSDLEIFKDRKLLSKSNYDLIPGSGIDIRRFSPVQTPPKPPPFIFLMMARLIEEKGVREYVKASGMLRKEGLPVCCQLLGAPEPNHKRSIPMGEISMGQVEYLGETADVRTYLNKSHAVVLPSYREGLSKSLLEAAAMGKPIIASDVPGCKEVVKDQINGLLCEPGNAADLRDKMKKLQALSTKQLEEMGKAGRNLVLEHFTEDRVINIYLKAIKKIV